MTEPIASTRSAGILFHPTSLPGPHGIGALGPAARDWVDFLATAGQKWWQILPLGPTGYGDSPYQCFSALAGNPFLIDLEALRAVGLLTDAELAVDFPAEHVDFGPVIAFKNRALAQAWERFSAQPRGALRAEFEAFVAAEAGWLDDFALFMALKDANGGVSWQEWEPALRLREPAALAEARQKLHATIGLHQFRQFLFFKQWRAVKAYANERGVKLIGDVPIFVAIDSADVWSQPEYFQLDEQRRPLAVAGVPPDYFSATGQLWGNPLYDWEALAADRYAWWVRRLRATLEQVDLVRIDHFRGFEAYWKIPAGMPTAQVGAWTPGPGRALFDEIRAQLGDLPLIAEDLGVITPEVDALRHAAKLPGMRVLQFAFGGATEDRFLPHMYERDTVVYTGTHDNDTTRGWYEHITEPERDRVRRYLACDGRDVAWDMIRAAWMSVADLAVAPLQDVLDLGSAARMNTPGQPGGNWGWRLRPGQLQPWQRDRLGDLTALYAR